MTEKFEEANSSHELKEFIYADSALLGIIIRANYRSNEVEFFTDNDLSQQLGFMSRPRGHLIEPHLHRKVLREVRLTSEVLVIRSGKLIVDFFDGEKKYICSRFLFKGDVILLVEGGHGFTVVEDVEMIEVKQGPYVGERDKERFNLLLTKEDRKFE